MQNTSVIEYRIKVDELQNIITEKQKVIGTIEFYGRFSVLSIPQWKRDILKKIGIDKNNSVLIHVINTLECGENEKGLCIGDNGNSVGPFQINGVHKEAYKHSKKLLLEGKYKELYEYQAKWTYNRIKTSKTCFGKTGEDYITCQLVDHNRNPAIHKKSGMVYRDYYAVKGLYMYRKLKSLL